MNDTPTTWQKAVTFSRLHVPGDPIVLPNAWDPVSAQVIASAGARAIATSSAAISWAHGRRDGGCLSRHEAIAAAARIVAASDLPVSADIESGYGTDDADLAVTLRGFLDVSIVGINLEDSGTGDPAAPLRPIEAAARRIQVARVVADERGIPLYINARVDTYIEKAGDATGRFDQTLRRAEAYLAAGASGIFIPAVQDPRLIGQLVEAIDAPVNILVGPGSPKVAELAGLGVARISTGSSLAASALGFLRDAATEVLALGTYEKFAHKFSYAELNDFFPAATTYPKHFGR